jgi:hypothetical protein
MRAQMIDCPSRQSILLKLESPFGDDVRISMGAQDKRPPLLVVFC